MSKLLPILLLALVPLVLCGKLCLHAGNVIMQPVVLTAADCVGADRNIGCMAKIYKYKDFRYNGPASLLPDLGEIFVFLVIDPWDNIDGVMIMNPKTKQTVIRTFVEFEGVEPTKLILIDDGPAGDDYGAWDGVLNKGEWNLTVQPTFTDGLVLGHLKFIDKYCVKSRYIPTIVGQIEYLSLVSGTLSNITRNLKFPFMADSQFAYCQYPVVEVSQKDVTGCPGGVNGMANITVDKTIGPAGTYRYTWRNSDGDIVSTSSSMINVPAGTYTLVVEINGCDTNRTITILPPTPILIGPIIIDFISGGAKANVTKVSGGSPPYTYRWTQGTTLVATTQDATGLEIGQAYNFTVTDQCGTQIRKLVHILCEPGFYLNTATDKCVICPPGRFSDKPSATCTICPANKYTPGGKTKCIDCLPSEISTAGSGKCSLCPPGQKRFLSETTCNPCPKGKYRCSTSGGCIDCPKGTFANALGSFVCEPCNPGYYTSTVGTTLCKICPIGTYATGGASSCTSCPLGSSSIAGSNEISACM